MSHDRTEPSFVLVARPAVPFRETQHRPRFLTCSELPLLAALACCAAAPLFLRVVVSTNRFDRCALEVLCSLGNTVSVCISGTRRRTGGAFCELRSSELGFHTDDASRVVALYSSCETLPRTPPLCDGRSSLNVVCAQPPANTLWGPCVATAVALQLLARGDARCGWVRAPASNHWFLRVGLDECRARTNTSYARGLVALQKTDRVSKSETEKPPRPRANR